MLLLRFCDCLLSPSPERPKSKQVGASTAGCTMGCRRSEGYWSSQGFSRKAKTPQIKSHWLASFLFLHLFLRLCVCFGFAKEPSYDFFRASLASATEILAAPGRCPAPPLAVLTLPMLGEDPGHFGNKEVASWLLRFQASILGGHSS